MFTGVMIILFSIGPNLIFANDNYPLESGEILLDERVADNGNVDIFTQLDNQVYLKKLAKVEGTWKVISLEPIEAKATGFIASDTISKGDRELAGSIDSKLKSFGLAAASLPRAVDYSQSDLLPPVGEQFEESCVGWSTGYYLRTYQQAKDIGWQVKSGEDGVVEHIFSPSFIYNKINNGLDRGASIMAAAELLKSTGDATLDKFPYVPRDYLTQPAQEVILSAYPNRIREWRLLYSSQDSHDYIIQKVKEYLNTGDLLVAGNKIGYNFVDPPLINGKHVITKESYVPYKHAFVIIGYDDDFSTPDGNGAFRIINSWGKEWGDDGFAYISYEAFAANALEGFVFTDLENSVRRNLAVDLANSVIFNIDFSGTGRFDIRINNSNNETVYEAKSIRGTEGINKYVWNGRNNEGIAAADGTYKFSIIPYKDETPKTPVEVSFNKAGRVESASASAHIYEDVIDYVEIPVLFRNNGILNISVSYNEVKTAIITGQAVTAGESMVYKIPKNQYDFNSKELENIKIDIDVQ